MKPSHGFGRPTSVALQTDQGPEIAAAAAAAPSDGLPQPQRRRAYLALAAATSMAVLDGSIANTALPAIARELHVSPALSIWVVNGFQVAVTMTLFAAASYGRHRGLSRTFRYGVALFAFGSFCCSIASTLPLLVAARVLQGAGAATVMGLGPALLRLVFPREQLGRAIGINSLVVATSAAAGPAIGGAILAVAPWPWLFAVNVPIGIAIALLARGALPPDEAPRGALDVPSFFASAAGFGGLIYGVDALVRPEERLFGAACFLAGAASFAWFLRRQQRLASPMFDVDLFGRPLFAFAAATSFLSFNAWGLAFVALPFLFQIELGATPLQSGLMMTPWPLTMALVAPFAGRLSDKYPAAILSTIGLAVLVTGLALYATLPAHPSVLEIVLHGAVCGLGSGLYQAPNSRELMGSAPREKSGSASAILAAMRVSGQTCGAATVAVIFAAFAVTLAAHVGSTAVREAVSVALWAATAFAALAMASSITRLRFPRLARV